MKVLMTEYLRVDLDKETWECRVCNHEIGSANTNYKHGLLVYDRDPREIHQPVIDPQRYEFTFSPDPEWVRILEYYCPSCGTQVEAEYATPGHPPIYDIELDLPALKAQWSKREEVKEPVVGPDVDYAASDHHHHHNHSH